MKHNHSSIQHDKKQFGQTGTADTEMLADTDAPATVALGSRVADKASLTSLGAAGDGLQFVVNDTADHVVNAAEATGVAFTVSGLAPGESGTVTFADAVNHQVTADVTGNGTYTADLSSLTDGTILSSLSAANPAGNGHTASGNSVLLDTDKDVQPVVSVDAANPAHVTFNISGLEGDEHGTMTFTDTTGQQAVVNAGSNGSYAADLSSLKQGTITYLLTETDPAGNTVSVDPPISLGDGSANAPSGTPQLSNILSGYAVRPAWNVAGVDYYVGTPSGTVLKDPSTISIAGVSVDKSAHIITVNNSNVTLDGYDFGLSGGWQVDVVNNANNVTIQNSHFQVGANDLMPIQAYYGGTINVLNNTFDGGGSGGSSVNAMVFTGTGGATIEYNRFTNFPNDGIDITHDGNYVVQYNVFDTAGAGAYHTDAIQTYFSAISSLSIQYNTMYEPPSFSNSGINSFVRIGDQQGNVVHNPVAAYNTIIMASTNAETANVFQWGAGGTATLVNPQIHDNFIDPTGVMYGVVSPYLQDPAGVINPVTYKNVNLTTGNPLLTGLYNSMWSGVPAAPPAAPVITGESAVSATQVKLAGTAVASTTVDIYDQGALLGTVTASSSGAWSFTTPQLANGDHSFTARATDSLTNSSAPSAALAVTVTSSGTIVPPSAPTIASFSTDSGVVGDHITNDNTLTLAGTAVANSTVKVFDGSAQIGTTTANSSGSWDYITSVLTNAKHVLTATATDSSGKTSMASSGLAVTVDTVAPNAPVIASSAPASNNAYLLNGTAEANSTVKVFDGSNQIGTATANNAGAWSYATATLTSGTHSLTAKATDAAGNTGAASAALAVTVTPTVPAPAAPKIASFSTDSGVLGDGITNDSTLTLSGTAAANSTVKVLDGTTQVGTATANASGAWSLTTAAMADGGHKLTATATSAGVTSAASAALAVTIDTHAPTAPTIATPASAATLASTATNVVSLTGMAEANSTVKVFDGTSQIGTATANSAGTWSYTTPTLTSGSHSFTAKAMDVAGNTGAASAALAVTVTPTVPTPAAPKIAAFSTDSGVTGDGITNDNTLTLTGTAAANSLVKVSDGTTQVGTATANASGAWSLTTLVLADGGHKLTATATSAGMTSAASAALAVTIDTHAPTAPTIATPASAATLASTATNVASLTGTAEANSTVKVFDGTSQIGTATANSAGTWSYTTPTLTSGSHSFTAKATDVAGNISAASAALAVTVTPTVPAPAAPKIAAFSTDSGVAGDGITNDNTLTLTGMAAANSLVKVLDGTTQVGTATANASGAWSLTTVALADGGHKLTATEISAGMTSAASAALAVTIDTHAPTAPKILTSSHDTGVVGDGITSDDTLVLTGTAEAHSTVKVADGTHQIGTAIANSAGTWTFATEPLTNGGHSFTAKAMDEAGNTSAASAALAMKVDTHAPQVGFTGLVELWNGAVTLKGTAEASSLVTIYDGTKASPLGTVTAGADGTWKLSTTELSNTIHTFKAQAVDSAGNVGSSSGVAVYGTTGNNTLTSGSGNDVLAGHGGSDTFVFAANFGKDTITDFQSSGRAHDVVQFSASTFDSFASVLAHAAQSGQDVVISADPNNSLTLKHTKLSDLHQSDFHFA